MLSRAKKLLANGIVEHEFNERITSVAYDTYHTERERKSSVLRKFINNREAVSEKRTDLIL